MMNPFKQDEVVVLLGAGASIEANMPDSTSMIRNVEELVNEQRGKWSEYRPLYHYVKSAIHYAAGIKGQFGDDVLFNIEKFVNTLEELSKRDDHPLYPFVGAWNPKLVEVAGENFEKVGAFRNKIVEILRDDWIELKVHEHADYYKGLVDFQREYEHPLRVFSLNYDKCVEIACKEASIERGFNRDRRWDWRLFEDTTNDPKQIYLYKLHGSTDWKYDESRNLTYLDSTSAIKPEEVAIIFGSSYKLQYIDPFLFLVYQFRKWTLDDSRLIITVGYGFGDEHINGIIRQALDRSRERRLLAVAPCGNLNQEQKEKEIGCVLQCAEDSGQITCWNLTAKAFMTDCLKIAKLAELFPPEEDLIKEIMPFRFVQKRI
jgi:hypothetical protein